MKKHLLICLTILSLSSFAQEPSRERFLNIGLSIGEGVSFHAQDNDQTPITPVARPLFMDGINHFSLGVQLGSLYLPKFIYTLEIGYHTLRTGFGLPGSTMWDGELYRGYEMPYAFLKPGLGYRQPLGERWALISQLALGLNQNLDKQRLITDHSIQYETSGFFMTIDPSLELRINLTGGWNLGVYTNYGFGVNDVITATFLDKSGESQFLASYKGNGISYGFRLSFCFQCREEDR